MSRKEEFDVTALVVFTIAVVFVLAFGFFLKVG